MKLGRKLKRQDSLETITGLTKHPREFLGQVLKVAVYQTYGVDFMPEVNKQAKAIEAGNGKHIDYVFPCFELANLLKSNPGEVAETLAEHVKRWLHKSHPTMLDNVQTEAVSGYINFELSENYLSETAYYVAHWLQKPQSRKDRNKYVFLLVAGSTLGQAADDQHAETVYRFISDIYHVAGYNLKSEYLIPDSSEEIAELLNLQMWINDNNDQAQSVADYRQELSISAPLAQREKKISAWLASLETDLTRANVKKLQDLLKHYIQAVNLSNFEDSTKPNAQQESEIIAKTNRWIDEYSLNSEGLGLIRDPESKAAYYHIESGPMASLRTATGVPLKAAYLLYATNKLLKKVKQDKTASPIIVIAPQRFHQLLYNHANRVIIESAFNSFVCIDPAVAQKALMHQEKLPESLSTALTQVSHTLAYAISRKAYNTEDRQKILSLIDVPVEFRELVTKSRPLELVTLLSNSVATAEQLRD